MKKSQPDKILMIIIAGIIFFGLFILASAASVGSDIRFFQQVVMGFIPGLLIAYLLYRTPLTVIEKIAPYALLINIILLILTFLPFLGVSARGATRWVGIGPLTFQPTEFLKLTFILYLSAWIIKKTQFQKKKEILSYKETLIPFIFIAIFIGFLLLKQPDFSTFIIILSTSFVIYYSAKTPLWHSMVIFSGSIVGASLLIYLAPYRLARLMTTFGGGDDPFGSSYQIRQILVTVGSGGLFGRGIGMSLQKYGFVPLPATDSIFAILAEETGFIGGVILIALFLAFFYRGFLDAKNNTNGFARLVTIGICFWIFFQASINIGIAVGVFPVTGIPLPLISHGKSHLIAELAALGVLLNASQYVRK